MTKRRISIMDTTLRDGEQAPGASLKPEQKIALASRLIDMGVDVLEPGFPVSSPGEFAAVEAISRLSHDVEICGFARAVRGDIDAAVRATRDAARRRIHLFISSSDIHIEHQLRMRRKDVVQQAKEMVAYARQFCDTVEFTAMDATRTNIDDLIEMVEAAIGEGASIINLPDTVGYALPAEYGSMFLRVREGARGGQNVRYSAHCHNDLGLAVANSLEAIRCGADQIEVTVNGIGERTGNCALEELVMALETRGEVMGAQTGIRPGQLYEVSMAVSRAMHFPVSYNKPVIGRNAFQHESGIHQDGLLKNRNTYEIMDPEALGIPRSMIILGKHSGRHALKDRLQKYGVELADGELDAFYERFKETADREKTVSDDRLLQLVDQTFHKNVQPYELAGIRAAAESEKQFTASVLIKHQGEAEAKMYSAGAESQVEAVIAAISHAVQGDMQIEDVEIHTMGSGEQAYTEAFVTVCCMGKTYHGSASHRDHLLAVGIACLSACNAAQLVVL
ncbi:2-isopropylmalate synthase [Paenibacillus jiagnxiensis]|uniref:2-isopropylmalate synthase n=1 Tax=Paenibacillus jiagnxiensis TaxID=3228926 RepID=UPI0033AF3C5E